MNTNSYTQLYTRIAGAILAIVGIIGFTASTNVDTLGTVAGLDVNLTSNLLHIVAGIVGLAIVFGFASIMSLRTYTLVLGVVFSVLGIGGIAMTGFDPFSAFGNVNDMTNWFHAVIGIAGLAAWLASSNEVESSTI
jgi:hypothetical protein